MLSDLERAWLRLHLTRGLGRRGLFRLRAQFRSPEAAIEAGPERWPRIGSLRPGETEIPDGNSTILSTAIARLEGAGARIISFWDDAYPEILKSIHDPPALLYVLGNLDHEPALAIVGSRRCTEIGKRTTREFSRELARNRITIISGLARGIDSEAHEGALDGNGKTLAVLGCGIDRIYPPESRSLFRRIRDNGAVISEYPPGTPPLPGHFPGRNRIISGLSQGVLIVEAAEGSGSLITADFALEQGREVFAVPGSITSPTSCGVNNLLKDGAHLVTAPSDILDILRPGMALRPADSGQKALDGLTDMERKLVDELSGNPVQIDDLARKSGLTPMELSAILLQLELRGSVSQLPGMRFIRKT